MPRSAIAFLFIWGCVPPTLPDDPPLSSRIDAVLGPRQREGIVPGSTGTRLECRGLDRRPGLQGRFEYDGAIGSLFELEISEAGRAIVFPPLVHQWWPSHVGMEGRAEGLRLLERKFLTRDDRGIDLVRLENEGPEPRKLVLRMRGQGNLAGEGFRNQLREVVLNPKSAIEFTLEAAFGSEPRLGTPDEVLSRHLAEYSSWYAKNIPDFECPDAWFTRLWYHRWFIVRRTRATGSPIQLAELRWLRNPELPPAWLAAIGRFLSLFAIEFYPHAARIVPKDDRRYDAVFDRLFGPLWAPFPVRTADGTRPAVNSIALEALASAIKYYRSPNVTKARFFDLLQRTVRMQYDGGDFTKPRVGEVLDPDTGAWRTPADDVFDSTFADILIRHMGGLTPRSDAVLEFDPIVEAFPFFRFRNVPYRGALLEIVWDLPDGRDVFGDGVEGFTVRRGGKTLFTVPRLAHVEWDERSGPHFR